MFFWRKKKSKFAEPQKEPLFAAVHNSDPEMHEAYALAASTLDRFVASIHRGGTHVCAAKLRLRDPYTSERLGEDRFVFMWLSDIRHEASTDRFVGAFFEVPPQLNAWYQRGQCMEFHNHEIFDWFVNDDGCLHGGYTLRVARSRLPEAERANFDAYTGVSEWVGT